MNPTRTNSPPMQPSVCLAPVSEWVTIFVAVDSPQAYAPESACKLGHKGRMASMRDRFAICSRLSSREWATGNYSKRSVRHLLL